MNKRVPTPSWLTLAIRQREWQAELGQPELREALNAEQRAEVQRQRAQASLQLAQLAHVELQGRRFTVDALERRALYTSQQQRMLGEAEDAAGEANRAADELRQEAQALLAERDALQDHLDTLQANARIEQQRKDSRAHDEHWLLRRARGVELATASQTEGEAQ